MTAAYADGGIVRPNSPEPLGRADRMMISRMLVAALIATLSVGAVNAETFRTKDPLRAMKTHIFSVVS
jgi:hypothetical protein